MTRRNASPSTEPRAVVESRAVLADLYEVVTGDRDKSWPAGWMAVKIGWIGHPKEVRAAGDLVTEITGRLDPSNEAPVIQHGHIVANTHGGDIPKQFKYGAGFPMNDKQAMLLQDEPAATVALMRDLVLFLQTAEVDGLNMGFDYDTAVRLSTEVDLVELLRLGLGRYSNTEFTEGYSAIIISEGSLQQFIAGYSEAADVEEYIHTMFTKIGKLHGFEWEIIDHVTVGFMKTRRKKRRVFKYRLPRVPR